MTRRTLSLEPLGKSLLRVTLLQAKRITPSALDARNETSVWLALVQTARQILVLVQSGALIARLVRQGETLHGVVDFLEDEVFDLLLSSATNLAA